METADVRKRIKDTIERARRQSAERRTHNSEASAAFEVFLQSRAVPVFQQVANVLRVEGYPFVVHTPAGSVRLASEKSAHDFIDMRLDTTARPQVVLRVERVKGRETTSEERPLKPGTTVQHLTDEDVLDAISEALMVLVDR
jgi:hypothetical protein